MTADEDAHPLGLESGVVRLVPYDERWPGLFDAEAARLGAIVAEFRLGLEHTGSTAIRGMPAKPVLDILAGRPSTASVPRLITALEHAGYTYRGEQGVAGRAFFRRGQPRAYHVHLVEIGSTFWRDHLAFRDRLRRDPVAAADYAALKTALAARHPRDRESYIAGKTEFVARVLALAGPPGDTRSWSANDLAEGT